MNPLFRTLRGIGALVTRGRGDVLVGLARPMARHPMRFVAGGIVVALLGAIGFVRFGVDAGADLLVGSSSDAGTTYARFAADYGADPIVVVIRSDPDHPQAFYQEANLLRLIRLESDLRHDSRVASVTGPGTAAEAASTARSAEVANLETGFQASVELLAIGSRAQQRGAVTANGGIDTSKLTQDDYTQSQTLAQQDLAYLQQVVVAVAQKAEATRAAYAPQPGDRIIDARERAADAAGVALLANDQADATAHPGTMQLPPGFAAYVGGTSPNAATLAKQAIVSYGSIFGECDGQLAAALKLPHTSCQSFLDRYFLDLPNCPTVSQAQAGAFCEPKSTWSALLARHSQGDSSYAVITVRLTAEAGRDPSQANDVARRLRDELDHGVSDPKDTSGILAKLGPLTPTTCGTPTAVDLPATKGCTDQPLSYTVAGVPLLTGALTDSVTHLLLVLFPLAGAVMALLLVGSFRVRGRLWPLLAAALASTLTLGLALAIGTPVTPAVLAGVPVLVGLGVDYAVQLVARLAEERRGGLGVEAALRVTLARGGPATLVAAIATVVGLLVLAVLGGVDAGRVNVAVPLVAEFALVLVVGVIIAWLLAVLVALPAAAAAELRRDARGVVEDIDEKPAKPSNARRTLALAKRPRALLALAVLPALLGWILLPRVGVETDVERLLARSLTQLQDVETVRAQTGTANELDIYLEGSSVGELAGQTYDECLAQRAQSHPLVGTVASISQVILAESGAGLSGDACAAAANGGVRTPPASPAPSPSGSAPSPSTSAASASPPAPSPSPAPTAGSASPTASRSADDSGVIRASRGADTSGSVRRGQVAAAVLAADAAPNATAARALLADTAATAAPGPATPSSPTNAGPAPGMPGPGAAASPATTATPGPAGAAPGSASAAPGTTQPILRQSQAICDIRLVAALARGLASSVPEGTSACPPPFPGSSTLALGTDPNPVTIHSLRIPLGITTTSVADQAALIDALQRDAAATPVNGISAHVTGVVALAAAAYTALTGRALLLNLLPVLIVALVLLGIERNLRRGLLPVLPTVLAAGWGTLLVECAARLPGDLGRDLGSFTPLTVVLGALVVALATEFGVVLLHRFYEEREAGLSPDDAASAALAGVGRSILVSASTLGAGFMVLAASALVPGSLPLISSFGLTVVVDLALAVLAVFGVMLPTAVALERWRPAAVAVRDGGFRRAEPSRKPGRGAAPGRAATAPEPRGRATARTNLEPSSSTTSRGQSSGTSRGTTPPIAAARPTASAAGGTVARSQPPPRRLPGGVRRRPAPLPVEPDALVPRSAARLPGLSGRRRSPSGAPPVAEMTTPSASPGPGSPQPSPGRPRRPGSIIPRRSAAAPADPGPAPEASIPAAPPGLTTGGAQSPPASVAPSQQPRQARQGPNPSTPASSPPRPTSADSPGDSRHRRRRPPSRVRRQQREEGPADTQD